MSDYLKIKEAATLLGISPSTLRNWERAGKIPTYRHPLNGYRLYKRQDVLDFLARVEQSAHGEGPQKSPAKEVEIMETLEIKGFRGFGHLVIPQLGRVNLIVGKNNAGKSSLLEALRLYGSQGSPSVIRNILLARNELVPRRRVLLSRRDMMPELPPDRLYRMFYLHHNPTYTPDPIEIGALEDSGSRLRIDLGWYSAVPGDKGHSVWQPVFMAPAETPWASRPAWTVQVGDRAHPLVFLDTLPDLSYHWVVKRTDKGAVQFLPAHGLDSTLLGRLYDEAAKAGRVSDALLGLRLIAPEVDDVLLVGEGASREVLVRQGDGDPVPLASMGDGMNRVLGIILTLVNARNGFFLADEIENGIHYSVMPRLWHLVFTLAAELNVQVFSTTHSWDCVAGFQRAAAEDRNSLGMLIRLERRKGSTEVTLFDEEELAIATRDRIEVR